MNDRPPLKLPQFDPTPNNHTKHQSIRLLRLNERLQLRPPRFDLKAH
jgi:hypothetical protein